MTRNILLPISYIFWTDSDISYPCKEECIIIIIVVVTKFGVYILVLNIQQDNNKNLGFRLAIDKWLLELRFELAGAGDLGSNYG